MGTSFSGKSSILAGRAAPSLPSHPMASRKFLFLNTSHVSSQLTHRPLSQPASSTPEPAHRSCSGMPTDCSLPPLLPPEVSIGSWQFSVEMCTYTNKQRWDYKRHEYIHEDQHSRVNIRTQICKRAGADSRIWCFSGTFCDGFADPGVW